MKGNFTVETYLVKETKNFWYYDIRIAKNGKRTPEVSGYEYKQEVRPVTGNGLIKIKKTSDIEDVDWKKQIYAHFVNTYGGKGRRISFIRF